MAVWPVGLGNYFVCKRFAVCNPNKSRARYRTIEYNLHHMNKEICIINVKGSKVSDQN